METIIEHQLNRVIERKSKANQLANLIEGYGLYARTEGKSPKTIRITTTAATTLRDFLEANGFSTNVTEIGTQEHLGHASFNTTSKYRKVAGEEHRKWYESLLSKMD